MTSWLLCKSYTHSHQLCNILPTPARHYIIIATFSGVCAHLVMAEQNTVTQRWQKLCHGCCCWHHRCMYEGRHMASSACHFQAQVSLKQFLCNSRLKTSIIYAIDCHLPYRAGVQPTSGTSRHGDDEQCCATIMTLLHKELTFYVINVRLRA